MYELMGNIILALSGLLALSIPFLALVEIYDEIKAWRDRRRKKDGEDSESHIRLVSDSEVRSGGA